MAFIRTKRIKGAEYAYMVENLWKKGNVKQKSKLYLGKVYRFDKTEFQGFCEFLGITDVEQYANSNDKEKILNDLVKWSLICHGFKEDDGVLCNGDCSFKKMAIVNSKGNNAAVAMNEGYLTTYAIRKILGFKGSSGEDGYVLAKLFVEAGIDVPKEVFIGFFSKGI